ncbi:MAG: integrase core domain-containing protein, partial [Anaerolineae bacterium]|nr:integrase core domain-containing protein [Anaerolineae bacterium]
GSVRRELLDHILILSERHLRQKVKAYVHYFNYARPHQGIDGQIPISLVSLPPITPPLASLRSTPVLGGLHHDYHWAA